MSEVAVNGDDFREQRYGGASPAGAIFTTPSPPPSSRSQGTTSLASSTRVETGQPDTPVRCFPDIDKIVNSFAVDDETANYSATEDTTEFVEAEDEGRQPQEVEAVLTDDGVLLGQEQQHDDDEHSESNSEIPPVAFEEKDENRNCVPEIFEEAESNVGMEELATDRYEPSPEFMQAEEEVEIELEVKESSPAVPDKEHLLLADEKNVEAVPTEEDDSYSAGDEEQQQQQHDATVVKESEPISESLLRYPTDEELVAAVEQEEKCQEPISAEEEYEKYVKAKRESSFSENVDSISANEMESAGAVALSRVEAEGETKPMVGTSHILILTSSMGMNNRKQHRGLQLLDALGFSYETLNGADPANKDIRQELFRISGMRGVYPLFFLVKDSFEQTENPVEFLGDWETIEGINDSSSLPKEILDANPGLLTWDKIPGLVRNKQ